MIFRFARYLFLWGKNKLLAFFSVQQTTQEEELSRGDFLARRRYGSAQEGIENGCGWDGGNIVWPFAPVDGGFPAEGVLSIVGTPVVVFSKSIGFSSKPWSCPSGNRGRGIQCSSSEEL